jgi:hypothetical protein
MIMADILMWFLLVAGTYVVFIGYWLATLASRGRRLMF